MIHFVVHEDGDSVGTVVVEGVKKGAKLTGWVMEQDKMVTLATRSDDDDRPPGVITPGLDLASYESGRPDESTAWRHGDERVLNRSAGD